MAKFLFEKKDIYKTNVLMTYSDNLYFFGKWYLQLWAESIGKNKRGITAIHSIGTTDQHSQLQMWMDGPKNLIFSVVLPKKRSKDLKEQIENGADFAQIAAEFSACPSGAQGGSLGEFSQGMMVPEFDAVVFSDELGKVHGPVQTQFGYHLIEITSRSD